MNKEIELTAPQIENIRKRTEEVRRMFGVYGDVPIANDIFMLLEKNHIILCEYPFDTSEGSHTDATLTRFEEKGTSLVFIGLNTSLPYDEQIFALAHELYHFKTKTGKAYTDEDIESPLIEKQADRFAAELLLPATALHSQVVSEYKTEKIESSFYLRTLRFVARLQCEWWLPYHAIITRLYEEGYIEASFFEQLYAIDDRKSESAYCRIFSAIDPEKYTLLNSCTRRKGVSNSALETILLNYEEGEVTDDEFVELLDLLGKSPHDFGYDLSLSPEDLDDLCDLFEGGDSDEY
jgi:Zn-dependent peptidase ImmA (M78 family)